MVYHVDEPLMLVGKVQASISLSECELLLRRTHYTVMARYPLGFAEGMPTGNCGIVR